MGRDNDRRMLRDALDLKTLDEGAREAFKDMLDRLEETPTLQHDLTAKQRAWVLKVLDVPTYSNDVSSGRVSRVLRHNHGELAECGAACPAWTPPTLRNLPKRPPTRTP